MALLPKRCLLSAALISRSTWRSLSSLKEAYVYHPRKETLEADVQVLLWTKTQRVDHFPQPFSEIKNGLKLDKFAHLVTQTVLASRVYEMQEVKMKYKNKPRDLTKGTHKNFPFSLMCNLFRMMLSHSPSYPQLRNLSLSLEPFVSASWLCVEDKMSVRGRVDMIVNSKQPFPQFYDSDIIQKSTDYDFKSLGDVLPFVDLKKYPVNPRFSTGSTQAQAKFPYAHTLCVLDNENYMEPPSKGVPEIQLIQKGIVFTFGRLYAQAVSRHGLEMIGKDLPTPECAQCIVTDGQRFSFIWYQLNTLSTNCLREGVKNLVYVHRPGLLYSSIDSDGIFRKTVAELDKDIVRTLLSMFLL